MNAIVPVESITALHELIGYSKPRHPLISLIDVRNIQPPQVFNDLRIRLGFYCISLKSGMVGGMAYGRQYYDFQEGSLIFMAPNQVMTVDIAEAEQDVSGWMLCIHPEFIRGDNLAKDIDNYTFFSYASNEALHLSDYEKNIINQIADAIRNEYNNNLDLYSRTLMLSNLKLMLHYANRYYNRQFLTRDSVHSDIIKNFEQKLSDRFHLDQMEEKGSPTVKEMARSMGYSTYYLSDLLRKETGKSTLDYIQEQMLNLAKDLLIGTSEPISQIGYKLGFEYPSHFSKFFKSKMGITPSEYRK